MTSPIRSYVPGDKSAAVSQAIVDRIQRGRTVTQDDVEVMLRRHGAPSDALEGVMKHVSHANHIIEELRQHVSRPGDLGLPELLDQRRIEYCIVDDFFRTQACFNRVHIFQIADTCSEDTFVQGGVIFMPDQVKEREKRAAPRGIIISAGLTALDHLRAHGMDLGHIVTFLQLSLFKRRVSRYAGVEQYLLPMQSGDLIDSEDTATLIRDGKLTAAWDDVLGQHVYVETGIQPMDVELKEDY